MYSKILTLLLVLVLVLSTLISPVALQAQDKLKQRKRYEVI
ncbi:MAG: hypothetical protein ACYCYE_12635 [Clostridia bacterium]